MQENSKSFFDEAREQEFVPQALAILSKGIAHDLNNALGAIMGYGDIIKDTNLESNGEPIDVILSKRIDNILSATHRAAAIINQLSTFARQVALEKTLGLVHATHDE